MATLIRFEAHDGSIRYECNSCLHTYMPTRPGRCPNCGRKFTKLVDEVAVTHDHRLALEAMYKDPSDENVQNVIRLHLQKLAMEQPDNEGVR